MHISELTAMHLNYDLQLIVFCMHYIEPKDEICCKVVQVKLVNYLGHETQEFMIHIMPILDSIEHFIFLKVLPF